MSTDTELVNLCGHPLSIPHLGIELPAESTAVKATQVHELKAIINGLPLYDIVYTNVSGLPEPSEGKLYIVSAVALNAIRELYPERKDVAATMKPIKCAHGKTIGCQALRIKG